MKTETNQMDARRTVDAPDKSAADSPANPQPPSAATTTSTPAPPRPQKSRQIRMELARRLLEALTGYEADDHNQARLLNRPDCRKPVTPRDAEKLWLRSLELPVPEHIWASNGCDKCHRIRYFGRIGIFELWRLGEEDYRLILEHADEHRLRRHFHERLHGGLIQDGLAKVVAGATSLSELRRAGSGAFPTETSV